MACHSALSAQTQQSLEMNCAVQNKFKAWMAYQKSDPSIPSPDNRVDKKKTQSGCQQQQGKKFFQRFMDEPRVVRVIISTAYLVASLQPVELELRWMAIEDERAKLIRKCDAGPPVRSVNYISSCGKRRLQRLQKAATRRTAIAASILRMTYNGIFDNQYASNEDEKRLCRERHMRISQDLQLKWSL